MQEIWKDIPGYEGLYLASSCGRIRSIGRQKKVLKPWTMKNGYQVVSLSYPRQQRIHYLVHRLVAMAFYGIQEGMEVCHNDDDRQKNLVENLRWDTPHENDMDMVRHGRSTRGEKDAMSKLKEKEVHLIRYLSYRGLSKMKTAKMFRVGWSQVYRIVNYERWAWLKSDPENYQKAA